MAEVTANEAMRIADPIIHDVGSAFMIHADTMARAGENGFDNPFAFYFAGRGGVLGDVDADVVVAAMGWFQPEMVRMMWEQGVAVAGAREAARRYGQACAAWGRDHLGSVEAIDRVAVLGQQLVGSAEGSGLPLFSGWRAEPLADDAPARAIQLIHTLREWRGGLHLVATTANGLSPLEAILTNEGEGQARFFGWTGDFPDCAALKERQDRAQQMTDALSEKVYERAFTSTERAEFVDALGAVKSSVLS
jgi:hypothetical protein